MKRDKLLLVLLAWVLNASGYAQLVPDLSAYRRPAEGWPAEVVELYQPIVADSTLLFPAPWLVWRCTCDREEEGEFFYTVDFGRVRKCWGRKQVYRMEEFVGAYAFVQDGLGQLYATLERDGDEFLYTELPLDSAATPTTARMFLDTEHIVRTDTMLVGVINEDRFATQVRRYVEMRRVR
jgi:hypothetical protein